VPAVLLQVENPAVIDERYERFDQEIEQARAISRDAIYRATLLSASVVAFSATLLSIDQLDVKADQSLLGASWSLFACVVVLGPLSVALEARAQLVVTWRSLQPQDFDQLDRKPTLLERLKLYGVLLYSLALRPRNLIYARHTDYDKDKPTQGMWMNFRMVLLAHKVRDLALSFEIVVWACFSGPSSFC
jgi:hypothetical protein